MSRKGYEDGGWAGRGSNCWFFQRLHPRHRTGEIPALSLPQGVFQSTQPLRLPGLLSALPWSPCSSPRAFLLSAGTGPTSGLSCTAPRVWTLAPCGHVPHVLLRQASGRCRQHATCNLSPPSPTRLRFPVCDAVDRVLGCRCHALWEPAFRGGRDLLGPGPEHCLVTQELRCVER